MRGSIPFAESLALRLKLLKGLDRSPLLLLLLLLLLRQMMLLLVQREILPQLQLQLLLLLLHLLLMRLSF